MDKDLTKIVLELKNSINSHNCEAFLGMIKNKMPQIDVDSFTSRGLIFTEDKKHSYIEQFICENLDILLKSIENGEIDLIYDISDIRYVTRDT